MPFTPFHMGPGLAIKAVGGRHVSLLVFGFSQVAIDIEPLVRIIRGDAVLHGFTHTYLGATLVALLAAAIGRPVGRFLLSQWTPDPSSPLHWLRDLEQVGVHDTVQQHVAVGPHEGAGDRRRPRDLLQIA